MLKVATVGSRIYFENHYPETGNYQSINFDVDERDYSWLESVINLKPDLTIFYRPELYPSKYLNRISGIKVAVLSEPIASFNGTKWIKSQETEARVKEYSRMDWEQFDWKIFYDPGQIQNVKKIGYPIDEFRPLPINTDQFVSLNLRRRQTEIDFLFVGKPTVHRNEILRPLQHSNLNFVWIAHGIYGKRLAEYMKQSQIVLNIHADGLPAFEPRVYLGAAAGAYVLTEKLSSEPFGFRQSILEIEDWSAISLTSQLCRINTLDYFYDALSLEKMSGQRFVRDLIERFGLK